MPIDLARLNTVEACETVHELELLDPIDNEPTGLFIAHKGRDARDVLAVSRKQGNAMLARDFKAQRGGKAEAPITIEEGTATTVEIAVAASVGWFTMEGGKKVDGLPFGETRMMFSPEAARELYANPGFAWVLRQLNDAAGDLGNFRSGKSSGSSTSPATKQS